MKTATDLLMTAPDAQVVRMQLVCRAIAAGEWADAALYLNNAIREERGTDWAFDARELAEFCEETAAA